MVVTCCKECPFFQQTMATLLSVFSGRSDTPQGVCTYHVASDSLIVGDLGMSPGEAHDEMVRKWWSRMTIPDARTMPPECPLHRQDILITIRQIN